jgi:alpha-glucosidase
MSRLSSRIFRTLELVFILAVSTGACATAFAQEDVSEAAPDAIAQVDQARFTVLTPQLIRMEWAADRKFEDHGSLIVINRRLPVPKFTHEEKDGWLLIDTGKLTLRYKLGSGAFASENLAAEFNLNGKLVKWAPGMPNPGNLGGTTRTLDGAYGAVPLAQGILSRDGWFLLDDSATPLFDSNISGKTWPWAMARPSHEYKDFYLFAYGHDYRGELRDYTRVAGKIPLPPRFVFGAWWSRYWAYTDQEFEELVDEFHEHDVPLDVLVVDMDWHPTFGTRWWENKLDPSGHTLGWTGYSWNPLYFPDPAGFLKLMHSEGLKVTLNMHPASGVQPFEDAYPEMARAMGIDPATKQYVSFDIANQKFATNYMNIVHHPLEKRGVDFFWLDWQQENRTSLAGLNPTWWLNYVHFTDMEREGKRPLLFHRWGGLGDHRYQIGFSGDVITSWASLAFQPYFTATAANVGYGYWSHDIGGHLPGPVEPELYTRWVQWGAFSPILRTHTTKNPGSERRIWAFPDIYAQAMRKAFLQRYALVPYIYTSARQTYDTGVSLLHPLYYEFPDTDAAYTHPDEYFFGSDMIVAPVVTPLDPISQLASRTLWLPDGDWVEWTTDERVRGPKEITRLFALDEVPVYVRAGSMIPMAPKMPSTAAKPLDPLIISIFPAKSGAGKLYEDAGNSTGYKHTEFAWTKFTQTTNADGSLQIDVMPEAGAFQGMQLARRYELRIAGTWPPESVTSNGAAIGYSARTDKPQTTAGWSYDGETATTIIDTAKFNVRQKVSIRIVFPKHDAALLENIGGKIARLQAAMHTLENTWEQGWAPDILLDAAQSGHRVTLDPKKAEAEYQKLAREWPEIIKTIDTLDVNRTAINAALAQIRSINP